MKTGSDNFRDAAILDIMAQLKARGFDIVIYEPSVDKYQDYVIDNDLGRFATDSDIIIANRVSVEHRILFGKKLITRDIFGTD